MVAMGAYLPRHLSISDTMEGFTPKNRIHTQQKICELCEIFEIRDVRVAAAPQGGTIEQSDPEFTIKTPFVEHITVNPSQKRDREDESGDVADKKWLGWPGENVFRLVVPLQKVGGIIGRKGEFVKKMCEETNSRIKILDGIPGTSERVVMVSAKDEPAATISPAMNGLLRVHQHLIDNSSADNGGGHAPVGVISSRLLVAATQAGSLIGKHGATIKSIQDASSTTVRVLPAEDVPLCALADDRVVEIQGEAQNVHKAIELITVHLRKFLVDRSVLQLFELNRQVTNQLQRQQNAPAAPWGNSSGAALPPRTGPSLGNSSHYSSNLHDNYYQAPDHHLDSQNGHHGVSMYGRDPSIVGLSSSLAAPPSAPVITQVTQHMQVPLSYADAIIGTAGANISYMRRTSGATITIQETANVLGEMTVEIHGSATQVQTVQQLIQNFMAGASGPPVSTYTVDSSYNSYGSQNSLYTSSTSNPSDSTGGYGSHYNSSYIGFLNS
ncbi:hypothetical protein O6H91_12G029500 [Diphasiastrum complanatum]|uniref:Uncharacterized protein n=1 Tax=Diphasiastrum complanatum TaxID=34168 RepID=A0ACC2C070_DIPCM|nr:hypothetical protein O6H91_12G029500 [Diphasiastrum complanatum]